VVLALVIKSELRHCLTDICQLSACMFTEIGDCGRRGGSISRRFNKVFGLKDAQRISDFVFWIRNPVR
jgi:hypothetical protein